MKDQKTDNDSYSPVLKGAILPALAVGGGLLAGSFLGGQAGRALVNTPRFRHFLENATPKQKQKLLSMITPVSGAIGAAGGAGSAAVAQALLDKQLRKRRERTEKTAMFLACLRHLEELQ